MSDSISAFRIYFTANDDTMEKFIASPPEPWQTHGHERCKVVLPNAKGFKDAWSVVFWAEGLGDFESKADLERGLLRALKDTRLTYYVVEDVSALKAETDRLEKIRTELNTGKCVFGISE